MRIVVTGGRGFLGRSLAPLLEKHDVLSIVRTSDEETRSEGHTCVVGDLTRDGAWQEAIEHFTPEWCIHLAWDGLPDYSLARCRINLDANVRLIETLARARVRRVVVAGSCWEYGQAAGAVSEDTAPTGYGVFAATKHAIRTMLDAVSRETAFDYRWARVFFTYGPGQRESALIPHVRRSFVDGSPLAVRDATSVQDFVHVDDVARGLVALAECDAPSGIFNLGSGQPSSVGEISNLVAGHYGKKPPFPGVRGSGGFWANTDRTWSAAGWRAEIGITQGVELTLAALDRAA